MKKLFLLAILSGGMTTFALWRSDENQGRLVKFRTADVRRGDVRASVSATGTIEPEEVVDVGVQVAGEVVAFGPDPRGEGRTISYGSPVEKGAILAQLNDALYKARLDQARANLEKAEADVEQAEVKQRQAERDFDRSRRLLNKGPGMVPLQDAQNSESNYEVSKAAVSVCRSSAAVARANLEEATANLGYTTIRSPVKGVILDRRVNIGQTVVASLNAPSLFLIAKDLSRMEIWASVNETDIGSIHVGQPADFTVGAFPGETFGGAVSQVRLNASMVQNVVTYTVAVSFDNPSGKLLPYLTARVEFEIEAHEAVLLVPKAALRWQPRIEFVAPSEREDYARSLRPRPETILGGPARGEAGGRARIWVQVGEFVRAIPVRTGLSDGVVTEVDGEGVVEGTRAVVGVERAEEGDLSSFLPHTRSAEKPAGGEDAKGGPKP
jgi:HlyD family secretion protein